MKKLKLKNCCFCLPLHFGGIVFGIYVSFAALVGFVCVILRVSVYKHFHSCCELFDYVQLFTVAVELALFFLGGLLLYGVYMQSSKLLIWANITCFVVVLCSAILEVISLVTVGKYGVFCLKLAFYVTFLYFTLVMWSYCQELRQNEDLPKNEVNLIAISRSPSKTSSRGGQRSNTRKKELNI